MEMELSKLTMEIFSKLEQKWLNEAWGALSPAKPRTKTCILSIDGGFGPEGLVAAQALVHLETLLQSHTNNPSARISDFFHLVAGTGMGGVLACLLTAPLRVSQSPEKVPPLFSASQAMQLLMSTIPEMFRPVGGLFRRNRRRFSGKSFESVMKRALGALTLRDTCLPLLVPCFDLNSSAPFVFSRADASGSPSFDFELWEVCRAATANPTLFKPFRLTSVDRKTSCIAVDGGLVMNNPSAAAVTHILHNKRDFPGVNGVEDLLVLSIGNGKPGRGPSSSGTNSEATGAASNGGGCSSADVMEIVLRGASDTVDQMLSNAFCWNPNDYVRIQANGLLWEGEGREEAGAEEGLRKAGERMLEEKGVESLPFGGKRLLTESNAQRIDLFVRRMVGSPPDVVEPLLLLPPPSPSRHRDHNAAVEQQQLADGRRD